MKAFIIIVLIFIENESTILKYVLCSAENEESTHCGNRYLEPCMIQ